MKNILLFIWILLGNITIYGQFNYKCESKFLSFTSPVELTKVPQKSVDDFYWQNDEFSVEITCYGMGYYNTFYEGQTCRGITEQLAHDQSFYDITKGDTLPDIKTGYFRLAKSPGISSNQYAYVYVIAGYHEIKKTYFEARVYCYSNKPKIGLEIVRSFSFGK